MVSAQVTAERGRIKKDVLKAWDVWIVDHPPKSGVLTTTHDGYPFFMGIRARGLFKEGYTDGEAWQTVATWLSDHRKVQDG